MTIFLQAQSSGLGHLKYAVYVKMRIEEMMKRKLAVLFKEMCCSQCKSDFDEESFKIMREEEGAMLVLKIICNECGKSFGVAFLGISDFDLKNYDEEDLTLRIQDGPKPIDEDEVLDAHKFIKELDINWKKFIEKLDDVEDVDDSED